MTIKDYNLIANAILELSGSGITDCSRMRNIKECLTEIFSKRLQKQEKTFNQDKFYNKIYGK